MDMTKTEFMTIPWQTFKCRSLSDINPDEASLVAIIDKVVPLRDDQNNQIGWACTFPDLTTILKIDPSYKFSDLNNCKPYLDLNYENT
jgi:hypothetical protein